MILWEEWRLGELAENLRKYVERNPLRENEAKRKTEDLKHRPWKKEKEKENGYFLAGTTED